MFRRNRPQHKRTRLAHMPQFNILPFTQNARGWSKVTSRSWNEVTVLQPVQIDTVEVTASHSTQVRSVEDYQHPLAIVPRTALTEEIQQFRLRVSL